MSATPVSICSNALLMLGDTPISSFDDPSDRALLASNLWETARDYVLRRHPWNCAVKRAVLNPDETGPDFDFAYQFTLPGDFLRVLSVGEEGERPRYRVEGRKILAETGALRLRYIFRNENVATWDAGLVWAMTLVMRAIFAYGITQSTSLEQLVEGVMRDVLKQARAVDGQEDEPDALDHSPLLEARYVGSTRW
jgi:hypothetical protein